MFIVRETGRVGEARFGTAISDHVDLLIGKKGNGERGEGGEPGV
jgi:hypothetical protein